MKSIAYNGRIYYAIGSPQSKARLAEALRLAQALSAASEPAQERNAILRAYLGLPASAPLPQEIALAFSTL